MDKPISRFAFNQNDYEKGTNLLQEYEYKGYFIREFEQEPCDKWKRYIDQFDDDIETPDDEWFELTGSERGEGGYEILNSKGELIYSDWEGMGDSATCNAENEVDWFVRGDIADELGIDISGKNKIEIDKLIEENTK